MFEAEWRCKAEEKREKQKRRYAGPLIPPTFPCPHCPRKFYSRIGLLSLRRGHQRRVHRTLKTIDAQTRCNADDDCSQERSVTATLLLR